MNALQWLDHLKSMSYPELLDLSTQKVYIADEKNLIYIDYVLTTYPNMDRDLVQYYKIFKENILKYNGWV